MKSISRRKFIGDSAKGAALISASGLAASCSFFGGKDGGIQIPQRTLGKTGLKVSILSFGGGSQFAMNEDGKWEGLMDEAIKSGINLFDTAPSYNKYKGGGSALGSDGRFALVLPKHRDKVIISTKLETRKAGEVKKEVAESLARLKTEYIDILLIHAINNSDDVGIIEKGIYKEITALKEAGIVKHIGFSSMDSAQRSKDLLDNLDIDVALLAMNATRYGDYAELALPSAIKQNSGVIAMKVMRNLIGKGATVNELMEYAWGQEGVASALIAHNGIKPLKENIQLAQNYQGANLLSVNRKDLELRLAKYAGPETLCWARPGYRDGNFFA